MTIDTTTLSSRSPSGFPVNMAQPELMHTVEVKRVLRNTYALLAMTLLFSAIVASASVAYRLPAPGMILTLAGYFGLLFAIHKMQNSAWALHTGPLVDAFAGITRRRANRVPGARSDRCNFSQLVGLCVADTARLQLHGRFSVLRHGDCLGCRHRSHGI